MLDIESSTCKFLACDKFAVDVKSNQHTLELQDCNITPAVLMYRLVVRTDQTGSLKHATKI
jgi:hypothetical protein